MIRKVFRQMLLTQILSGMTVILCMLIDSIMIGRFLGVESMTAYGLTTPLLLAFTAVGSMISAGVQVLCSKTIGSGDKEGTDACFTNSVTFAACFAVVGMALVIALLKPITRLLGADPADGNVYWLTMDYLRGFIIGAPAFVVAQIMVPYLQLSGQRKQLVAAVAAMTAADVVMDLLNVLVFHGGTFGMGLASSLSYYIAFIVGGSYFFSKKCLFHYRFRLNRLKVFGTLSYHGLPTVINQISMVLHILLLNKLILKVSGTLGVAAYSIISTIGNLCYCIGGGIASVAVMLAAILYIDEDRSAIRELVETMRRYAIFINLAATVLVLLFAGPLVGLFLTAENMAARELAVGGLRLFVISLIPSALNSSFKSYCQGINRSRLTELVSVLQNFASPMFFAYLLTAFMGVTGVWLSFLGGELLTFLIFSVIVWKTCGRITWSADAYTLLPADFSVPESDCMETTILSAEEVCKASELCSDFCRDHGGDPKLSYYIALCVEEMAANIVLHGFNKDDRPHSIEMRLLKKEDTFMVRLRDNCVDFDPLNYLKLHERDEDPTAHIGIRLVMKLVRDATYVNSLGMNNLTLLIERKA